jgi:TP901 family phage tail tape measure protein
MLDKNLAQIGQTAGESTKMVAGLRQEAFKMGKQTGQEIENLTDGFNSLVQSGQSWKAALESAKGINIASAVTGAGSNILAGGLTVGATAFNIDLEKSGQALELLDKMVVAGRLGNAELENLSAIFARVGVNAATAGMDFDKTLAFIETLTLSEKSPERLATLSDSTLRLFTNMQYLQKAERKTKVKFFDEFGGRRDPVEVLKDLRKKYNELPTDLQKGRFMQKAFGGVDMDTLRGLRSLFQGDFLEKAMAFNEEIKSASGTLERDMDAATRNLIDQSNRLKNNLREAADGFAGPIKDVLTDMIRWSMDTKANGGLDLSGKEMLAGSAAAVAGTALLARYGSKFASKLMTGPGSAVAGIATGKLVEEATGVSPVFVTNWPAVGIGGGNTAVAAGGAGMAKNIAKYGGLAGLAGAAGYGAGTLINEGWGWAAGKVSDGKYEGSGWLGDMLYDFMHKEQDRKININMIIDEKGRVIAEADDMNTNVKPEIRRGRFGYGVQGGW